MPKAASSRFAEALPAMVVLLIGTAARIVYLNSAPVIVTNDTMDYVHGALDILHGASLSDLNPVRTPGYSFFVATIFSLAGKSGYAVAVAQQLLFAALAAVVTLTAGRYVKTTFAVMAGLVVALDPITSLYANCVLTESVFSILLTLVALTPFIMKPGLTFGAVLGMFLGFATLVRPNGIIAAVVMLVFILWSAVNHVSLRTHYLRSFAASVIVVAGLLLPWMSFQYQRLGEFTLAENQYPFLIDQMLYYQGVFDPELIDDFAIREIYDTVIATRASDDFQTRAVRPGFPFALRSAITEKLGADRSAQFFADYLTKFKATNLTTYYALVTRTFLSLLHLGYSRMWTPLTANRYLGEIVPHDKQLSSIVTSDLDREILYHPAQHGLVRAWWQQMLHLIDRFKIAFSLVLLAGIAIAMLKSTKIVEGVALYPPRLFLFLPYTIFITQAAAYAWILHTDDRYTYVCNPLLYFQAIMLVTVFVPSKAHQL